MKYLLCSLLFILCTFAFAQKEAFADMDSISKHEYLVKVASDVIKRLGPDFYDESCIPTVSDTIAFDKKDVGSYEELKIHLGRKYYIVEFPSNAPLKDGVRLTSSKVYIWADTGEPQRVIFGNGWGFPFFLVPYKDFIQNGVVMPLINK